MTVAVSSATVRMPVGERNFQAVAVENRGHSGSRKRVEKH